MDGKDYEWIRCIDQLPPLNTKVMSKTEDADGCRNIQELVLYQREKTSKPMWFLPDMSMYVYYSPTHWANIS